jgi:uncharacterized protein
MIAVKVDQLFLSNMGFVVLLKGAQDERSLPIFIGAAEAQAIAIWMNRVEIPRPLTHDLLKNVLDCLECRLERVEVCDLREGTFYARLILATGGGEFEMDSRPSDAIALALRAEAALFVDDSVMDRAGRVFTAEELAGAQASAAEPAPAGAAAPAAAPQARLTPLQILQRDLQKAVDEERYEDAARLRDEIAHLSGPHKDN